MFDDLVARALAAAARGDDDARWVVIRALQVDGRESTHRETVRLCESDDAARRQLGADILAQFAEMTPERHNRCASAPVLARLLHDPVDAVVASAIAAHGHLSLAIPPERLDVFASHPTVDVRFALALALPTCGGEQAEEFLIRMMSDAIDAIRDGATFGLGSMLDSDTPEIREALLQRTVDPHDDTRAEALVGLARRGDRRGLAPLRHELRADAVGRLAVEAARDLADPALLPDLEALRAWWDVDSELLTEAIASCQSGRRGEQSKEEGRGKVGLLTDFVIAREDEADALGEAEDPADTWPTLEAKGVETVKLATLCALAANDSDDADAFAGAFDLVAGDAEEGPWILAVPAEIVAVLAGIPDARLASIASRWAETDELQMDGWSAADARDFIGKLRRHAKQALADGASLFLRISM